MWLLTDCNDVPVMEPALVEELCDADGHTKDALFADYRLRRLFFVEKCDDN